VNTKMNLKAIGWAALALFNVLFMLFIIYAILKAEERNQDTMLVLDQGERTTGTIIRQKSIPGSWDENDLYVVRYTFILPSGQEVIGTYQFDGAIPSGWNVGDQQEIAYDQQNPNLNVPVSAGYHDKSGEFLFLAILGFLAFSGLVFLFGFMSWKSWKLSKFTIYTIKD